MLTGRWGYGPGYRRFGGGAGRVLEDLRAPAPGRPVGLRHDACVAVPFITRRHVHRAVPQAARPDPHPTSAGYPGLGRRRPRRGGRHRREERLHHARQAQRRRTGPGAGAGAGAVSPAPWAARFGQARTPFGKSIPARDLFPRQAHAEPIARISFCVVESALGVVTGTPGAGKMVALRTAVALDPTRHQVRSGSEPEHVAVRAARCRSRLAAEAMAHHMQPLRRRFQRGSQLRGQRSLRIRAARGRGDIRAPNGAVFPQIPGDVIPDLRRQRCAMQQQPPAPTSVHANNYAQAAGVAANGTRRLYPEPQAFTRRSMTHASKALHK